MNQGVRMNQLNCGPHHYDIFRYGFAEGLGCRTYKEGANPLATRPEWIECALSKWWWPSVFKSRLEAPIDSVAVRDAPFIEVH